MFGIELPNLDDCNCAYTTSAGQDIKMSFSSLIEVMKSIPEKPEIFVMDIDVFSSPFLKGNKIVLSKDIADALERTINGDKNADRNSNGKESI